MIEARVTADLSGLGERFARVAAKIQEAALYSVSEWLRAVVRGTFRDDSSPEGVPWQPWSPKYAMHGHGKGMLEKSGALFDQVGSPRAAPQIQGNTITLGSTLPYAAVHQFGFEGDVSVRESKSFVLHTGEDTWGRLLNSKLARETRQIIARGIRVQKNRAHTRHMKIPARPYLPTAAYVEAEGSEIARQAVVEKLSEEGIE